MRVQTRENLLYLNFKFSWTFCWYMPIRTMILESILLSVLQLICPLPDISVVKALQLLGWAAACGDITQAQDPASIHQHVLRVCYICNCLFHSLNFWCQKFFCVNCIPCNCKTLGITIFYVVNEQS